MKIVAVLIILAWAALAAAGVVTVREVTARMPAVVVGA